MELQKTNFNGFEVRFEIINSEIWFVANDLQTITGHVNIREAIRTMLDEEEVGKTDARNKAGALRQMTIINESGFYKLVFNSILPQAKVFTKYVTGVILPQIRKTGTFGTNQLQENVNQLGTHKENLKSLKIQSFELNKKIRFSKMKIDELETVLFSQKQLPPPPPQTDLFNIED